jgi:hypothetical protein
MDESLLQLQRAALLDNHEARRHCVRRALRGSVITDRGALPYHCFLEVSDG